jgi:PhzF family phenazine biosynthesis protein
MKLYIIDAFTDTLFSGNQAAVCPLDTWLPDTLMQSIAAENNLAETTFIVKENSHYHIRWFTPTVEVDLCGHATLAAAHVLFEHLGYEEPEIKFNSKSGELIVAKASNELTLNFPVDIIAEVPLSEAFQSCFSIKPQQVYKGKSDYMFVFASQSEVEQIFLDLNMIAALDARGVIITAKGDKVDFVSRFFAPQSGIDEDPVTGSAHTSLTPYWSEVLKKTKLKALQLSKRGGKLTCELSNNRVLISGAAKTYLIGDINVK